MADIYTDWTLDFGLDKTKLNASERKSFESIHRLLSEVQFLGKGE
jgi:hypothetical protein